LDKLTKEQRTKNMKAVKNKNSKIEILLRKKLWKKGYRYRKNCNDIFGKPDIVFKKLKIAIFCDSEFWHGYNWEQKKQEIKSNKEFWMKKIERNIERDIEVNEELTKTGWKVLRLWGKDIEKNTDLCIKKIEELMEEVKAR
jgi:DNA mismatch endonuclease, patch repair protein